MKRTLTTTTLVLLLMILGTAVVALYAKGYRITSHPKTKILGTGLLAVTSKPDGAKVYINGELRTATNDTISLLPEDYEVRIEKEGYFPWQKKISVKKEIVSQANALLFPIAPKLESLTSTGAQNPTLDPTGTLLAYGVSSASALKNGAYILSMSGGFPFPFLGGTTQIANNSLALFSEARFSFSQNGGELLASISSSLGPSYFLLSTKNFNDNPQNVTQSFAQVMKERSSELQGEAQKSEASLPRKVKKEVLPYIGRVNFSQDQDKILYTATRSAELPPVIVPPLPGTNSKPEVREIKEGNIYVYDVREDKNYLIFDKPQVGAREKIPNFVWHPDSRHIIFIIDQKINIIEYDGGNLTTVYAGPFDPSFVAPWPDGSALVTLTNLNIPGAPPNLYRISLR